MTELLPCPFCGGLPRYYRHNDAACADEKCPGFLMRHCPPDLWNRRDPAVLAALPEVQALVGAVIAPALDLLIGTMDGPMTPFQRLILADTLDQPLDRDDMYGALDHIQQMLGMLVNPDAQAALDARVAAAVREALQVKPLEWRELPSGDWVCSDYTIMFGERLYRNTDLYKGKRYRSLKAAKAAAQADAQARSDANLMPISAALIPSDAEAVSTPAPEETGQ